MNAIDFTPGSLPLTVIAPHLDDAVFSCGRLLAQHPGTVVVTVFAGIPAAGTAAPQWDRDAGFLTADASVQARRREDLQALALLGARHAWLAFLDGQYGVAYSPAEIADKLTALLEDRSGTVIAPMGVHHPDHQLVHAACMIVRDADVLTRTAEGPGHRTWLFYEDAIHRLNADVVDGRLSRWRRSGHAPTLAAALAAAVPASARDAAKAAAVSAYASQLPLFDAREQCDLRAPERYWSLCST